MTARYLLDTNIVSNLVREPNGPVAGRIAEVGENDVATSIVVAAELRYGAAKKSSVQLSRQLAIVLDLLAVLPLESPTDSVYGEIRAQLEKRGEPIGANDLWIAAQTLTLGCIVVTDNEKELERVEGLLVENWLEPRP